MEEKATRESWEESIEELIDDQWRDRAWLWITSGWQCLARTNNFVCITTMNFIMQNPVLRIWPLRSFGVYRTTARGDFDVFPSENRSLSESHDKTKYVQNFGCGGTNQDHERHKNHEITMKITTVHAYWTWLMNVSRDASKRLGLAGSNGHCLLLNVLHDYRCPLGSGLFSDCTCQMW